MSACNLPIEIIDEGIKIKELLKSGRYEKEASNIDFFLCQYDYKNVFGKSELIDSIIGACNIKEYGKLHIPNILHEEWLSILFSFRNKLDQMKGELIRDIAQISFETFQLGEKEFSFKKDVFGWVIKLNCLIFLLMEDGKFFNDNLVALEGSGKMLWCSSDNITCKNRMGACFVGLREENGEENIIAQAYAGVNYIINAATGEVRESKIVK